VPFTAGQRLLASQLNANMPQLLSSTVLTVSQPFITAAIPTGFNHLEGVFTTRKDVGGGGAFCWMQFNADTAAHYQWENVVGGVAGNSGASLVTIIQMGLCAGASDTTGYFASGKFSIGNVSSTAIAKSMVANSALACSGSTYYTATHGGVWNQAAAITTVTLLPDAGNFVAGSALSIYGWG
jgi:hypothetical protein